jgi:putative phosphoesterase
MKLAFISDIHSNVHALSEVLEKIDDLKVDEVFCCGDIVGYNAFPKECIDLVRELRIKSVIGNHDLATVDNKLSWFKEDCAMGIKYSIENLEKSDIKFLKNLDFELDFVRDGVSFYMCHGSPRDKIFEYIQPWFTEEVLSAIAKDVDADYIITGHTHIQMEAAVGSQVFLNPGSVGQPRDGIAKSCFMVFDTVELKASWYRLNYDIKAAADAVLKANLPVVFAEKLIEAK